MLVHVNVNVPEIPRKKRPFSSRVRLRAGARARSRKQPRAVYGLYHGQLLRRLDLTSRVSSQDECHVLVHVNLPELPRKKGPFYLYVHAH